jgi:hypothetical protein
MRLNIPAAFKGATQGNFIGIFQIATNWQTAS